MEKAEIEISEIFPGIEKGNQIYRETIQLPTGEFIHLEMGIGRNLGNKRMEHSGIESFRIEEYSSISEDARIAAFKQFV